MKFLVLFLLISISSNIFAGPRRERLSDVMGGILRSLEAENPDLARKQKLQKPSRELESIERLGNELIIAIKECSCFNNSGLS